MNSDGLLLSVGARIDRLRGDFDRSFTEPARAHEGDHAELLAVGAGGRPYALRLSQTAGLHPDRPVTPLPGPIPALMGLAGFAGTAIPVYDLAALLGHPGTGRPRWLVLAAGAPPLALAFHELHGHVRVPADTIVSETASDGAGCLRGMVALSGGTRPMVDVPSARLLVHTLAGHDRPASEETTR
jgi:chemotaxis signal transduction protein